MSNHKLTNVQILRGLAAIWVVVYHALGQAESFGVANKVLAFVAGFGYFGVDIFFVLSGFVIYYSVYSKNITASAFFRCRLERIVPPYFILTAVLFVAMLVMPGLFRSMNASVDHFLRSVLYLSFTGYDFPVLYIGWTLEYEMLFYVLASVALAFGVLTFNRLPIIISALVVAGATFTMIGGSFSALRFLTNPIILEFGFGFAIAAVFLAKKIDGFNIAALFIAVLGVALVDPAHRAILAGLPSAALLYVCLVLNHLVTLPRYVRAPLSALGDASYSIYLVQVFSLPVIDKLLRLTHVEVTANSFVLLATSFTILSGWAFFKLVEAPILGIFKVQRQRTLARALPT